ncbi:uncharacterized protein ACBR49_003625 [Aulostomus maculatus]
MDQRHSRAPCHRTCLMFCFKERVRLEQRETPDRLSDSKLRELTSKWFIETQVPLIVQNGFFPTWFLGFISRKNAEDILREKELGCFLVRLSDKAIGYILSYKGRDRCRHFVINQSESGQFVVSGDTERHDTISNLMEYYKRSPIEPFGEYLTSSCFEVLNSELYDIIQVNPEEKPVATIRAVKNVRKEQLSSEQPPSRPPKSKRAVEAIPPLPRRNRPLESDQDRVLYAQLRKQPRRRMPRPQHACQDYLPSENFRRTERSSNQDQNMRKLIMSGTDPVHSELGMLDCNSRSLPLLDHSYDGGEQTYSLSTPPNIPPRLAPKPNRRSGPEETSTGPSNLDYQSHSAVYHLAGRQRSPHTTPAEARSLPAEQDGGSVYSVVPSEAASAAGFLPRDNMYELIPGQEENRAQHKSTSHTYEPLEDIRPKHNHSLWGLRSDKWKWLIPEMKKKW